MTTLSFSGLLVLSADRYIGRAHKLHGLANSLWLRPLRRPVQSLAREVSENLAGLRLVGTHCTIPPSLPQWVLTVALLLLTSPRLAWRLMVLFYGCCSYRLVHYEAIAYGLATVFGSVAAFAVGRLLWSM